jgi:hypothetical protein
MLLKGGLNGMNPLLVCLEVHVSIYASICKCSHNHTLFVLVSFLAKEFNNIALMMTTLVKAHLKVVSMTTNPSTMRPISLAVSLFYDATLLCYTTKARKVSRRAKNSLNG